MVTEHGSSIVLSMWRQFVPNGSFGSNSISMAQRFCTGLTATDHATSIHRQNSQHLHLALLAVQAVRPNNAGSDMITRNPKVIYNGMPHVYPKLSPFRRSPLHLIHQSLDRPNSPPQTASKSNQPFATVTLRTDRPTDGLGDRSVPRPAYALCIDYCDAANNIIVGRTACTRCIDEGCCYRVARRVVCVSVCLCCA